MVKHSHRSGGLLRMFRSRTVRLRLISEPFLRFDQIYWSRSLFDSPGTDAKVSSQAACPNRPARRCDDWRNVLTLVTQSPNVKDFLHLEFMIYLVRFSANTISFLWNNSKRCWRGSSNPNRCSQSEFPPSSSVLGNQRKTFNDIHQLNPNYRVSDSTP